MDVIKIIFGGEMMIVCHAMAHNKLTACSLNKATSVHNSAGTLISH